MLTNAHGLSDKTKCAPEDRIPHESVVKGFVDLIGQKNQRHVTLSR